MSGSSSSCLRIQWRQPATGNKIAAHLRFGGEGLDVNFQGNIMRVVVMLLTLVVGVVLAGCEKTDFEKKSEADANARRVFNLKREASKD